MFQHGYAQGDGTVSYEDPFSAASAVDWFNGKDFQGTRNAWCMVVTAAAGVLSLGNVGAPSRPCASRGFLACVRCGFSTTKFPFPPGNSAHSPQQRSAITTPLLNLGGKRSSP